MRTALLWVAVTATATVAACGGSAKPVEAPPPPPKPAQCHAIGPYAEVILDDWRSKARPDFDAALKEGVAVVSYDCHSLKPLKGCRLPGGYVFAGWTRQESYFELKGADDVQANLPLSAAELIPDLKGDRKIDVAIFTIGKETTLRTAAKKDELQGSCDGATHFVRAVEIGAMAASLGPADRVRSAAEVFTAATGVSSTDEYLAGDSEAPCRASTSDVTTPPTRCARVRLELVAIGDAPLADEAGPRPNPCPEGLAQSGANCVSRVNKEVPHRCAPKDADECRNMCEKGNGESCWQLGLLLRAGGKRDAAKMKEAFEKASAAGFSRGDYEVALDLAKDGPNKDTAKADLLLLKACATGDAWVCWKMGTFYETGELLDRKSPTRALEAYKRGCNLGHGASCDNLAQMYMGGKGVPSDGEAAADLLERSCDAGGESSCGLLGTLYATGVGVDKDPKRARKLLERACDADASPDACTALAALDPSRAEELYEKGCKGKNLDACTKLGVMLEKKDKARAKKHWQDVCARLKDKNACTRAKKIR